MRIASGTIVALLSIILVTGYAHGQTLKKSTLTGEIRSASASVPLGTTGTVLLVPEDRFYVMTQACGGFGTLAGSEFGIVVSSGACDVYTPGIVFQPGEEIMYTAPLPFPGQVGTSPAMVMGVLVKPSNGEDD